MWPDNRIARDAHYLYRYDRHGRLTEKTDLIPEGVIRTDDERTHRYHYDSQHRLVHYTRTQYAEPLVESRYLYDPLGRRVAKRVWRRERDLTGWMSLSRKPQVTWYGWDGDRLTTIQNDRTRIQTIYQSGLYYNRHRYYDPLQGRYITQDPIGLKGGWNFYQYPLNPVQYIDSMGLASKYGHLNNGGYGARPNKPPTPDPSKLPDIAKQLRLPYPIDQASSAPNVFKTFFRALSPYDYTLYCRKWVKPNLTCTPQDDSQYPGMDTKTASDYLPQTNWPTTQLPPGYTCAEPYLFPDINKPDGPATAGIDDLGEILAKMKQRTSRGIRK
ncbi:TPA: RHS repeat protein [Escherichia coli]|nr:RHS repeat protein [Escherichia coli]